MHNKVRKSFKRIHNVLIKRRTAQKLKFEGNKSYRGTHFLQWKSSDSASSTDISEHNKQHQPSQMSHWTLILHFFTSCKLTSQIIQSNSDENSSSRSMSSSSLSSTTSFLFPPFLFPLALAGPLPLPFFLSFSVCSLTNL